jgi:hypothetical protein
VLEAEVDRLDGVGDAKLGADLVGGLEQRADRWWTSIPMKASRMTPSTTPPASRAASATLPIRPVLPPPYTRVWRPRAIAAPTRRASA